MLARASVVFRHWMSIIGAKSTYVSAAVDNLTAVRMERGLGSRSAVTHTARDMARSDHAAVELANDLLCFVASNARVRLFIDATERHMPNVRNALDVHAASKNTVRCNTLGNLSMD